MTARGPGTPRTLRLAALAAVLAGAALASPAARSAPPARALAAADLEGDWLSARFLDAVRATRAPVGAPDPLAFSVKKHGSGWRLVATSFHEGYWRTLAAVEARPDGTYAFVVGPMEHEPAGPKELARLPVSVTFGPAGPEAVTGKIWDGEGGKVTFRRLPAPRTAYVNRLVLAGAYRDEEGRRWEFAETGEARWPNETFRYELNLDSSEAGTDYLTRPDASEPDGRRRIGFAWKDGALRLSYVVYDRDYPISAASRPFAVLRPEAPGAPAPAPKGSAPRGVALEKLPVVPLHENEFDELVGGGARVEVHFREKGAKKMPEVLTAPPAVVRRLDRKGECRIDGGNWTPGTVWLSRDEKVLALVAFSGSNAQLELYDTATCQAVGTIEASQGKLDVAGDRVTYAGGCEWSDDTHGTCSPATVHVLDDAGVPRKLVPESRELTKRKFGLVFDAPSEIEFPGGGHPREKAGRTPWADAPKVLGPARAGP